MYRDARPLSQEDGPGLSHETRRETRPIYRSHVAIEPRPLGLPHPPRWMLHPIFFGSAVALHGIAPVVLGNEGGLGSRIRKHGATSGPHLQAMPACRETPGVGHAAGLTLRGV